MKVTITALKAPWPAGAGIGSIVDLGDVPALPAWAVGKCEPAGDGAEAAFTWTPPVPPAEPEKPRDLLAEALDAMPDKRDDLLARLAAAQATFAEGGPAQPGAVCHVSESGFPMVEALPGSEIVGDGSGKAAPPIFDRPAAEVEAKELGVSFNARTSDEVLAERIAAAKAA